MAAVQRWLKFTKYLPEFGWKPIVYVPQNPQYPLIDESLLGQVPKHVEMIRGHIWEARRFYRRFKKLRHGRQLSKWLARHPVGQQQRHNYDFSQYGRRQLTASLAGLLEDTIIGSIDIPSPKHAEFANR